MFQDILAKLTQILHLRETPHRTALAFAIGVAIAFSPTYGLHTVSVLFCAWAFRLNFLAILAGSLLNNPWTLVPILGLTFWTGFQITGSTPAVFEWENLTVMSFYEQVLPYLGSFLAGGFALTALGAAVSYPLAYLVISRTRAHRDRQDRKEEALPRESKLG